MVVPEVNVDGIEALRALLDGADAPVHARPVVVVATVVPPWLGDAVGACAVTGCDLAVALEPPSSLTGEALDGWEIGVLTALCSLGITDVRGADPRRLARVRVVVDRLAQAAPAEVTP